MSCGANGHYRDLYLIRDHVIRKKTRKHLHKTTAYPYSSRESLENKEKNTNKQLNFRFTNLSCITCVAITENLTGFPTILTNRYEGRNHYAKFSLKVKVQA